MAAQQGQDPELEVFNQLLASKKERDKKLRDFFVQHLKEKRSLQEKIDLFEQQGFVLVIGDEDFKRQVKELREQLNVLQIQAEVYLTDFEEERQDRAKARGELEDMKATHERFKQEKQEEIRKLSKQLQNVPKGRDRSESGSPSLQECKRLRMKVQRLEGELETTRRDLLELNELKIHEKERDGLIHNLEGQLTGYKQILSDNGLLHESSDSWITQSEGGIPKVTPPVGRGKQRGVNRYHGQAQLHNVPQPQRQDIPSTHLPSGSSSHNPVYSDEEPPLRAKDPSLGLVHSRSADDARHPSKSYSKRGLAQSQSVDPTVYYQHQPASRLVHNNSPDCELTQSAMYGNLENIPMRNSRSDSTFSRSYPSPYPPHNAGYNQRQGRWHDQHPQNMYHCNPGSSRQIRWQDNRSPPDKSPPLVHPPPVPRRMPITNESLSTSHGSSPANQQSQSQGFPHFQSTQPPNRLSPPSNVSGHRSSSPREARMEEKKPIYNNLPLDPDVVEQLQSSQETSIPLDNSFQPINENSQSDNDAEVITCNSPITFQPQHNPNLPPPTKPIDVQHTGSSGTTLGEEASQGDLKLSPRQRRGHLFEEELEREIHQINTELDYQTHEGRKQQTNEQAPFDPNLICWVCKKEHRIGEIQKFRDHVKYCQEDREARNASFAEKVAGDTKPFSRKFSSDKTIPHPDTHLIHPPPQGHTPRHHPRQQGPSPSDTSGHSSRINSTDPPVKPIPRKRSFNNPK